MSEGRWRLLPSDQHVLNGWAYQVFVMFSAMPYHVGSSLFAAEAAEPRDIDVRVMLPDDAYSAMDEHFRQGLNVAVSMWGQRVTGLPIDFQVQGVTAANEAFSGPRSAIGIDPSIRSVSPCA